VTAQWQHQGFGVNLELVPLDQVIQDMGDTGGFCVCANTSADLISRERSLGSAYNSKVGHAPVRLNNDRLQRDTQT
jgi:hypothetical protein